MKRSVLIVLLIGLVLVAPAKAAIPLVPFLSMRAR